MNCNLQRLDGPVRGNSKIVQELEGRFRGAGWNVIKVLWGSSWDDLFARDSAGLIAARLDELVDGDEQRIMTADGAIIRKDLFNSEGLAALVAHLSDDDLVDLCADVGGHDFIKLHAAYAQATAHKGQPTVVLMRTIKGFGLGPAFAGRNTTHQKKKAGMESIQYMRDDLGLKFTDEELENYPYVMPEDVPEVVAYAKQRRAVMDGIVPFSLGARAFRVGRRAARVGRRHNNGLECSMQRHVRVHIALHGLRCEAVDFPVELIQFRLPCSRGMVGAPNSGIM